MQCYCICGWASPNCACQGEIFEILCNHCFGEILSSRHCTNYSSPFVVITHISSADERSNSSPVSGKIDSHVVNPSSIRANPPTTAIPIHRLG